MTEQTTLLLLIIFVNGRITVELTWNTETLSATCCEGTDQLLMWNFTTGEHEIVLELHWYFNETHLICLYSRTKGFHVTPSYDGRVEQNGTMGILLKNVSSNDTGEYALYVKLDEEKEPNVQGIFVTVVESLPYECKPDIDIHPNNVISCSAKTCERSQLSTEWILNGTPVPGVVGRNLTINSSWTSSAVFCCLSGLKCHDEEKSDFCTPYNTRNQSESNIVRDTHYETNKTMWVALTVTLMLAVLTIVIFYIVRKRRISSDSENRPSYNTSAVPILTRVCSQLTKCADICSEEHKPFGVQDPQSGECNSGQQNSCIMNINGDADDTDTSETTSYFEDAVEENDVFAFPVCNATLEWILGKTYPDSLARSITVFNSSGIQIARKIEDMQCKHDINSSVYCEVQNTADNEWRLVVVLVNVTQENSGKYTGQLNYGAIKKINITKELKVIDKPVINETKIPTLHEPLNISCSVDAELKGLNYHWKLNGADLNSSERIYVESSYLTIKRLTMADTFSVFSCRVCSEINCCIESGTYVPVLYYASTVASSHGDNGGHRLELLGLGLVIVAALLVIIGILVSVTLMQTCAAKGLDLTYYRPLCQRNVRMNNIELCRETTEKQDSPLHTPVVQNTSCRSAKRSDYPKIRRKSKSLHKLFDDTQNIWNPVQKSLSLKTLIRVSHRVAKRANSDDSVSKMCSCENDSWPYSLEGPADRMRLEEPNAKVQNRKKLSIDDHNTGAKSLSLNNIRHGSLDLEPQDDPYSTIEEDALSVNHHARTIEHEENIRENRIHNENGNYEYDYATLPAL